MTLEEQADRQLPIYHLTRPSERRNVVEYVNNKVGGKPTAANIYRSSTVSTLHGQEFRSGLGEEAGALVFEWSFMLISGM